MKSEVTIIEEAVINKIYVIRDKKVLLATLFLVFF